MAAPESSGSVPAGEVWRRVRAGIALVPVAVYFAIYWQLKDAFRRLVRYGALAFLSISLLLFLLEVVMEFAGRPAIEHVNRELPALKPYLVGLFVLSGLIVIAHHVAETRHTKTGFSLSEMLWRFFNQSEANSESALLSGALPLIQGAFTKLGAQRVCVWTPAGEQLVVADGHWHPKGNDDLLRELMLGTGIAGLVYDDRLPRYVPRLTFPFNSPGLRWMSWNFRHALCFNIVQKQDDAAIDVVGKSLSIDAVTFPDKSTPKSLRSFVAVPVASGRQSPCIGVLCIDFKSTDPLDKSAIKMASVLGVILAAEVSRFVSTGAAALKREADLVAHAAVEDQGSAKA